MASATTASHPVAAAPRYEFTGETKVEWGITLRRIRALVRIGCHTAAGELGGWIECDGNLPQDEASWVFGNANVFGDANVSGNASVFGNARVYGTASVFKPMIAAARSDGYLFLIAAAKDGGLVIMAGCRYFTLTQAREHWTRTRGGTQLGHESLAIVDHLERMATIVGMRLDREQAA